MKRLIGLLLLTCMTVVCIACNRRDQYRENESISDTYEMTGEIQTNDFTPSPDMRNPYQNMSADELEALFFETSNRAQLSTDHAFNTPYYYIFSTSTFGTGGQAYSKLTGNVVTLCKDLACSHKGDDPCLYKGLIVDCVVVEDRIYILLNNFRGQYLLYSVNLQLDDTQLVYEWNETDSPSNLSPHNGKIYMTGFFMDKNSNIMCTMYVFDPQGKTYTKAMENDFVFQAGDIIAGVLYYTNQEGALWQYDIDTNIHKCLLDSALLNRENGDIRFVISETAGESYLCVMRQGVANSSLLYYDLSYGKIVPQEHFLTVEEGKIIAYTEAGQYCILRHDTASYQNDANYMYYNTQLNDGTVNYSGGEIWFRQDGEDELSLFTVMKTDGIPDAIRYIVAMDGKTMLVCYSTYKDFPNMYNESQENIDTNKDTHYALIDLETGIVYK